MRCLLRSVVPLVVLAVLAGLLPAAASGAPAGSTLLVSRPDGLGPVAPALDNFSETPGALSADGRYAVFSSGADGFAPGADPTVSNLFLRDTRTGTTTLVSRSDGPDGAGFNRESRNPSVAVTAAGHVLVAFDSEATNVSDHATGAVTPPPREELVWLRDVTAGTTTLVSRAGAAGPPANRFSASPSIAITAGGPVVAFTSGATNLGPTSGGVFLRTVDAGTTALISCRSGDCANPRGTAAGSPDVTVVPPGQGTVCAPPVHATGACVLVAFTVTDATIAGDGTRAQVVVAVATAPAAPGTPTGLPDRFVGGSQKSDGAFGNSTSFVPELSADGRAVAFLSFATDLTADAHAPDVVQAYIKRLDSGPIELVSTAGAAADRSVQSIALGGAVGHLRAAFQTSATNLGGTGSQTYLRDVEARRTSLLNRAPGPGGVAGDGPSFSAPAVSADGSAALFSTSSRNLGDDGSDFTRVRVRRLDAPAQPVELISRPSGTDPLGPSTASSFITGPGPVSNDGRFVVFTSRSDSLSNADDDHVQNVYIRDLLTARTVLVSRAAGADGAGADADASAVAISGDGRKVLFSSSASNLGGDAPPGVVQAYVRDIDAGTTTLASRADGPDGRPAPSTALPADLSDDGRTVVLLTAARLDPAADDGLFHVYVRDLVAGTTTLVDRDSGAAGTVPAVQSSAAVVDAEGGHVAWVSAAPIAGAPADGKSRIFVRDLRTRVTTLVSRADGPDGAPASGESFSPTISADGDTIAFTSRGQNLGATFPAGQVFVRDVAAGRTRLVSRGPDAGAPLPADSVRPAIDAAGERVAFAAEGAIASAPDFEVYVRDLPSETTELASRADGAGGAPSGADIRFMGISGNGNCVAFSGRVTNLNDGFASSDFESAHVRVMRGECPIAPAPGPTDSPGGGGPGPKPEGGNGGSVTGTNPQPVLSALTARPNRFHVGGRGGGTTIRFTLTRAATVRLRVDRLTVGRRKGRSCSSRGRGKRCTIVKRAGTFSMSGRSGKNRRSFSGKVGKKALRPGRYRVTATPNGGRGDRATVVVVKAPRVKRR